MSIDLSGRTALVTGGNRGIGLAVVKALADAGADVTFTARSEASASAAIETLGEGSKVASAICDVTDRDRLRAVMAAPFDILINNAGIVDPVG
ncbi:MAG: SDR family NAD(P)-dependent oxidoreductase, partial [Pseudomonadota bacterium]